MVDHSRRGRRAHVSLGLLVGVLLAPGASADWKLTVRGLEPALGEIPVIATVPASLPVGLYMLKEPGKAGRGVPAQVFQQKEHRLLAMIVPREATPSGISYSLVRLPDRDPIATTGIWFRPDGPNLVVEQNRKLLTGYHVDAGRKPFFFPLVGPTGESFTRAYPMESIPEEDHDHPHQRSCWFSHGNVNGIDFWAETTTSGSIRESSRRLVAEGPVLGRLDTTNRWLAPDGGTVLEDQRLVTFYNTTKVRIIDFEIQVTATAGPVIFHDTKEGMFGVRVASTMDVTKKNGGKITNADGLTDEKAWGKPAAWVDYVGPVKGQTVGIAILNHPASFRFPTTWHVRTYGLFAANPFGWHDFGQPMPGDHRLAAGASLTFRYRLILHDGDTASARVPAHFAAYQSPPSVEVRDE